MDSAIRNERSSDHNALAPMGKRLRQQHFLFEEGFVNLNHGEPQVPSPP
jgi:hypothetical protein